MSDQTTFTVGGHKFTLSKEVVELKLKGVEPESVREVYVEVNGKRYPIKQALSIAADLLRGSFTTHDAMRVFRKLSLVVGAEGIDPTTMPERCYTMLKSLAAFDEKHIRGVVRTLLAKSDRDQCFIGNYYRASANIASLLSLKSAKDLQAIAMLARSLFELAVDTKLIDVIPDSVLKIVTFSDIEKLRAARKIVKFKNANPAAGVDASAQAAFIADEAARIEEEQKKVWPRLKKVEHWSGENLADRVARLQAPFDAIYAVEYPRLSWYVHSGLTGFVNLKGEMFNMLAGDQNRLAGECYIVLLTTIIDEFGIAKFDAKVKNRLKLAKMLPFTDTPEESSALEQGLLA
ncbi:MAG: DUF5677 domain-containing protein [Bradyrhizobium sp.]|nr:DUF5677 domain-containing protein [Bradyrhizobium sp.]